MRYTDLSDEEFRDAVLEALTPSYTETLSTLYAAVRAGVHEERTGDVERVLRRPPPAFTKFVHDHRNA